MRSGCHSVRLIAEHYMESARGERQIVAIVAGLFDGIDGALLTRDVVQFAANLRAERLRHAGLADARRADEEPRGRVRLRRKLRENLLWFLQPDEIRDAARPVLLGQ